MTLAAEVGTRNEYHREYQRKLRETGQKLPRIPKPFDLVRRESCLADFKEFCRVYLAGRFKLNWSPNHHYAAEKIQTSIDSGQWYAWAMERGGGKSTFCEGGVIWSILKGVCPYVGLVLATADLANSRLENIKTELRYNTRLAQDFPDAIVPLVALDDEARKATGQRTADGEKTNVHWGQKGIQFPWIESEFSTCPGAIIEARGLQSSIRGLLKVLPNGESLRPTLVMADDPQTRQSAKSPSQTQTRFETLNGDLAFLVGPGEAMTVLCPCTKIYENDLADKILNRDQCPEWHGVIMRMVNKFPEDLTHWDKYGDILRASQKADESPEAANEYYRKNRKAMDKGFEVSWPENFSKGELSGIQHAMNLRIRNEEAFFAECQNEPMTAQSDMELLSPEQIARKVTNYGRRTVPDECSVITAFTDVQKEHLFWMVCAWSPDFTGYIIDYGAWPDQKRNYFTRRDVRKKLSATYDGDESGQMFGALTELGDKLAGTPYLTPEGRELHLSRWCIDGNWRSRTRAVEAYAKQSRYANILTITQGRGVTASQNPFSQAQRSLKWKTGPGWFWMDGPGPARWVTFDTNLWKKRIHDSLSLSIGSRGSVRLFKSPPQVHRMLADHLRAEKPTRVEANGRTVYEFAEIPGRDNEGLDCLVGCFLGASIVGVTRTSERFTSTVRKRKKVTYL